MPAVARARAPAPAKSPDSRCASRKHCKTPPPRRPVAIRRVLTRSKGFVIQPVAAPVSAAAAIRSADGDQTGLNWAKKFGFYPEEFVWEPCEVDEEFEEGDRIRVGALELEAIATPGHCSGHYSLLMQGKDQS